MANRRQLYKYKGDRCAYCGLSVQEMIDRHGTFNRMFEFNHVDPAKKHDDYDNLIDRVLSSEQLDEVDKCILMCRECHGILHAQNITCKLLVRVKVGNKQTEQCLKGQMIIDNLDRRATFLTNERVLVHPYRVSLGKKKPRIIFGKDLEKNLMPCYVQKIEEYKTIVVRSWEKREMFRAEHTGKSELTVDINIGFQLFSLELNGDDGKPTAWVRNGFALRKNGDIIRSGVVTLKRELPLTALPT